MSVQLHGKISLNRVPIYTNCTIFNWHTIYHPGHLSLYSEPRFARNDICVHLHANCIFTGQSKIVFCLDNNICQNPFVFRLLILLQKIRKNMRRPVALDISVLVNEKIHSITSLYGRSTFFKLYLEVYRFKIQFLKSFRQFLLKQRSISSIAFSCICSLLLYCSLPSGASV